MKLETFRQRNELTYAALAELIGRITAKTAERYCKGTTPRSPDTMRRIVDITAGAVTPNDWWDLPEPAVAPVTLSTPSPARQRHGGGCRQLSAMPARAKRQRSLDPDL